MWPWPGIAPGPFCRTPQARPSRHTVVAPAAGLRLRPGEFPSGQAAPRTTCRYPATTVNSEFSTLTLPVVLSVILISSR
jgi:hypothetical protein